MFTGRIKAENASDFQRAGFERAAQEYEQAARDEVHVAVAQLTKMFRAELRKRMGALQHQAEQTWTSNQVVFFVCEMNSVAGDALDKPEKKSGQSSNSSTSKVSEAISRASGRITAGCSTSPVKSSTRSPSSTSCE